MDYPPSAGMALYPRECEAMHKFAEEENVSEIADAISLLARTEGILVDLPVPCTFDFNVAATKYFYALEGGEAPLSLLFSGTVFHAAEDGALQVAQIPWEKEAHFRLPVPAWKGMMEHYYPNSAWLCLRKDVFDRLYRYKVGRGLPTWEQALEGHLPTTDEHRTP